MAATGPDLGHSPSTSSTHSHDSVIREARSGDTDQCIDYSDVFPGEWNPADAADLQGLGWSDTTAVQRASWNPARVPYWTRQNWDPNIEVSMDGRKRRRTRGQMDNFMRPAILERDRDIARTDYTRRWGINTLFPNTAEGLARSGLTPITAAPDPQAPRQWTHEESWQTWWFNGFTSQELTDTGAYAPGWVDSNGSDPLSQRPDELLHPLFQRGRWAQPRRSNGLGRSTKKRNFDLIYDLNGRRGRYDAENNDDVWAALRPSMQLASLVIYSGHPTFNMFLAGLYHMRRVPMANDGRTDNEKSHRDYRQYRALWHELDEDKMYDNARALRRLGFDAAGATLANLQNLLKWSFYEVDGTSNGSTTQDDDGSIHIFMNANNLWPLLCDEYNEGEKLPIRLKIASTMLHELCHAIHYAHDNLMVQPERHLSAAGIQCTYEIASRLRALRREAIGDIVRTGNGRQYFVEDEVLMEEGKAFENRLWGQGLEHWPTKSPPSRLKPVVAARNWPWQHPQVYLQNLGSVQAGQYTAFTNAPYKAFLLSPRAGVYELYTPLPVSNFARLFQFSWWTYDFPRYGFAALKNVSSTRDGQTPPLQTRISSPYNKGFSYLLIPLLGNNRAVRDFFFAAEAILTAQNQTLISAWLNMTTLDMVAAKIMRLRLHYERKTWDDKYNGIILQCQRIQNDTQTARANVRNEIAGMPTGNDPHTHLNNLIRQDIPQLHRLMDYESRYSQGIAAEYFLKDVDDRNLVRRSMHALLVHLQTIVPQLDAVQNDMLGLWSDMGGSPAFTSQVEDCQAVYSLLTTTKGALSDVIAILSGNTLDQREGTHGPLAGVPVCQREIKSGRNLRIAALREFARIQDPRLKRLIQTWINIVQVAQDIRLDDPSAEDYVGGGGTIAELNRANEQATANALAITLLDRQAQAQANRDAGVAPEEGEEAAINEISQAMADLETVSDIIDLYAGFSDDEKQRIRQEQIRQGRHPTL